MVEAKKPWIQTPLIRSAALSRAAGCNVYLKLENLQPSGSFKSRGISNFMLARLADIAAPNDDDILNRAIDRGEPQRHETTALSKASSLDASKASRAHFYCSSGGNAGLGCVHAAVTMNLPATIVVPMSTTEYMVDKLREAGATEVIQKGASWAEADKHLTEVILPQARETGIEPIYIHPFDNQDIWDGHATLVSEVWEQMRTIDRSYPTTLADDGGSASNEPDAVICSVGGGGLFCGVVEGVQANSNPSTRVIAVETEGADSLSQSLQAGQQVELDGITSIATSLGARKVCSRAFELASNRDTVSSVVLSDAQAVKACKRFADDERILVEPACGVCLAVCYEGMLKDLVPSFCESSRVVVVLCGGSNFSLEILEKYVRKFGV